MKTNSAAPTRRTSGFLSRGGRSVMLMVMLGLILLSMGWRAAHRYAAAPPAGMRHATLPRPAPMPLSSPRP